jgi:hypothetical protein
MVAVIMTQVSLKFSERYEILRAYLGWALSDLLTFCIVYDWLRVWFRIAHLAQDGRFPCICLADHENAKFRTLAADFVCI